MQLEITSDGVSAARGARHFRNAVGKLCKMRTKNSPLDLVKSVSLGILSRAVHVDRWEQMPDQVGFKRP